MGEIQPATLAFIDLPYEMRLCIGCQLRIDLGSNSIREALIFLEVMRALAQHMVIYAVPAVYKNPCFN